MNIRVAETDALFRFSGGDARKLLNILECWCCATSAEIVITDQKVTERLQENPAAYDKGGEMHYDIISAFIKSIRGSDPDAAVYWLARHGCRRRGSGFYCSTIGDFLRPKISDWLIPMHCFLPMPVSIPYRKLGGPKDESF